MSDLMLRITKLFLINNYDEKLSELDEIFDELPAFIDTLKKESQDDDADTTDKILLFLGSVPIPLLCIIILQLKNNDIEKYMSKYTEIMSHKK